MLIHLTPRLYVTFVPASSCSLVSLSCPELGLNLKGDIDLGVGRPWPNKSILVGMKKIGRAAIDGFFVETPRHVPEFTTTTRWLVDGNAIEHVITHQVLDEERDAVTQCMLLWHEHRSFDRRWPQALSEWSVTECQPTLDFLQSPTRKGCFDDVYVQSKGGPVRVERRVETFPMHTVERERLMLPSNPLYAIHKRLPALVDAFQAGPPC